MGRRGGGGGGQARLNRNEQVKQVNKCGVQGKRVLRPQQTRAACQREIERGVHTYTLSLSLSHTDREKLRLHTAMDRERRDGERERDGKRERESLSLSVSQVEARLDSSRCERHASRGPGLAPLGALVPAQPVVLAHLHRTPVLFRKKRPTGDAVRPGPAHLHGAGEWCTPFPPPGSRVRLLSGQRQPVVLAHWHHTPRLVSSGNSAAAMDRPEIDAFSAGPRSPGTPRFSRE